MAQVMRHITQAQLPCTYTTTIRTQESKQGADISAARETRASALCSLLAVYLSSLERERGDWYTAREERCAADLLSLATASLPR